MAFKPTVFFVVANQGTTPRILTTQTAQVIDANDTGITAFLLTAASLVDGSGATLAGDYAPAFKVTYGMDDGATTTGTIEFVRSGFDSLPATLRTRLLTAFATAGMLTATVRITKGATQDWKLPVRLASLRTADFLVTGGKAVPAHWPAGTAPTTNIVLHSASHSVTLRCAEIGAAVDLVRDANDAMTVTVAAPPIVTTSAGPLSSTFNLALNVASHLTELDGTTPAHTTGTSTTVDVSSTLRIDLHLPTECIVTVDRSGSMGVTTSGSTKWNEAVKAATLFSNLFGGSIPGQSTPASSVVDSCGMQFARWRWLSAFDVERQPSTAFSAASAQLVMTSGLTPDGGTPIGQALTDARARFTSGAWRRRHLILLTDGMDNSGSPSLSDVQGDSATYLPTLLDDAAAAVIVHTVSYALSGDTQVIDLHSLAKDHGGIFLGSETDQAAYDPQRLREAFLNILSRVLPIELSVNASTTTFTVSDGLERVIFVGTDGGGGTLSASTSSGDADNNHGTVGGGTSLIWASADDPQPATWTVAGASSSAHIYAIYDVNLRSEHQLEPHGLGKPIKVRLHLHDKGVPVTGADAWVGLRRPGESIGQVITSFVRRRGLVRALQPAGGQPLSPALVSLLGARDTSREKVISAARAAIGVPAAAGDTKSLQRLLLEAAERARNLELQNLGNAIPLEEVRPGVYEAEIPGSMTQEEGVYDFSFFAEGQTPAGYAFRRDRRESLALSPVPNAAESEVQVSSSSAGGKVLWQVVAFPRTATGRPLGPGLGYSLGFHYAHAADAKRLPALVTIDDLDGTYSTKLELPQGEQLPAIVLTLGAPKPGLPNGMPVDDKRRPRKVKVRLDKIRVLDDHDGCLSGAGELVFDAVVAPNANPARAVRTRLPAKGVLKVSSGQEVALGEVIYEGLVESGAKLVLTIGGKEFDYLLFFRREEKLARYHRSLPLKSSHYAPGDEPNDPESLRDWQVWYTVEVE